MVAAIRPAVPSLSRPCLASTLSLSRDGSVLAVATATGLSIIEGPRREAPRGVALDGLPPITLAAFSDQVWTIDPRGRLARYNPLGRPLGEPLELELHGPGHLVRSAVGTAAVWHGRALIELRDDLGVLAAAPLDRLVRVAVPIAPRSSIGVTAAGQVRIGARVLALPPGTDVHAGMALFGGSALALVVAVDGRPAVMVLSSRDGRLLRRIELSTTSRLAIAPGAGVVLTIEDDGLTAHDLRRGGRLWSAPLELEVAELAVDDELRVIAVRDHDGEVAVLDPEALRRARPITTAPVAPRPAPAATPPRPAPVAAIAAPVLAALHVPRLRALSPRRATRRVTSQVACELLERELALAGARCLAGIAEGWDSRRIGYASESAHPFELEVAAILGVSRGHADDYVAAARDRLAAAHHERATGADPRGPDAPLGRLARELHLGPRAIDVLMTIAAPTLWGELARLYGVLANDPHRPLVDELLVAQLLDAEHVSRWEVARELDPGSALLRFGVVHHDRRRERPFGALSVDPVVLARLRRARLASATTEVRVADRELDLLLVPRAPLVAAIAALAGGHRPARIVVRGRPGSGRRTVLAALARHAGRALGVIDVRLLPAPPEQLAAALADELRTAHLRGLLPCVAELDLLGAADPAARTRVAEVLASHPGPLAVRMGIDGEAPLPPHHITLDLPVLSDRSRLDLWTTTLAETTLEVDDAAQLSARYRVTAGTIVSVVEQVAGEQPDGDATEALERALRASRDRRLGTLATRVSRLSSWGDLVLPPDAIDGLRDLVGRIRHRRTVFEDWGFDATITSARGLTTLFDGRPGTGKSMVAGVLARELGLDLYRVDTARVVSKWLGETEKNLGAVFDAAEDGQCILLFDEADSLFAKRTDVKSSNDRYANLEVNYLLQRLDSFEGIAILTTNFGGAIDPAFRRRVSFRLTFPFPDEEARARLWRVHLPPTLPLAGPLDLAALAERYQLSGGYIRNACLRAAFLAAQEGVHMSQDHLERAVTLEYQQIGKLSTSGPVE